MNEYMENINNIIFDKWMNAKWSQCKLVVRKLIERKTILKHHPLKMSTFLINTFIHSYTRLNTNYPFICLFIIPPMHSFIYSFDWMMN